MVILLCATILAAVWIGVRLSTREHAAARPVRKWFFVSFDDVSISLRVETESPWQAQLGFSDVERICIKMEPDAFLGVSNGLYIWVKGRENSYAIPLDADGSPALIKELTRRGQLPAELVVQAMGSTSGTFCWPPITQ
jgi:hypothetical protein